MIGEVKKKIGMIINFIIHILCNGGFIVDKTRKKKRKAY